MCSERNVPLNIQWKIRCKIRAAPITCQHQFGQQFESFSTEAQLI